MKHNFHSFSFNAFRCRCFHSLSFREKSLGSFLWVTTELDRKSKIETNKSDERSFIRSDESCPLSTVTRQSFLNFSQLAFGLEIKADYSRKCLFIKSPKNTFANRVKSVFIVSSPGTFHRLTRAIPKAADYKLEKRVTGMLLLRETTQLSRENATLQFQHGKYFQHMRNVNPLVEYKDAFAIHVLMILQKLITRRCKMWQETSAHLSYNRNTELIERTFSNTWELEFCEALNCHKLSKKNDKL